MQILGFLIEMKPVDLPEGVEHYTFFITINAPTPDEALQLARNKAYLFNAEVQQIAVTYNKPF